MIYTSIAFTYDSDIATITLNRPEKRNALDMALTRDLLEALRTADAEEGMHCVVLTARARGFVPAPTSPSSRG